MEFHGYINAYQKSFITWYLNYIRSLENYIDYETDTGVKRRIILGSPNIENNNELVIRGTSKFQQSGNQVNKAKLRDAIIISFEVTEIPQGGIEVKGKCNNKELNNYFKKIIQAILVEWSGCENYTRNKEYLLLGTEKFVLMKWLKNYLTHSERNLFFTNASPFGGSDEMFILEYPYTPFGVSIKFQVKSEVKKKIITDINIHVTEENKDFIRIMIDYPQILFNWVMQLMVDVSNYYKSNGIAANSISNFPPGINKYDDILTENEMNPDEKEIYVPKRPKDYRRWKSIWSWVKQQSHEGKSYEEMSSWLKKMHKNSAVGPDTLRKICKAGDAGFLNK